MSSEHDECRCLVVDGGFLLHGLVRGLDDGRGNCDPDIMTIATDESCLSRWRADLEFHRLAQAKRHVPRGG